MSLGDYKSMQKEPGGPADAPVRFEDDYPEEAESLQVTYLYGRRHGTIIVLPNGLIFTDWKTYRKYRMTHPIPG